jgi:hypothetical protein
MPSLQSGSAFSVGSYPWPLHLTLSLSYLLSKYSTFWQERILRRLLSLTQDFNLHLQKMNLFAFLLIVLNLLSDSLDFETWGLLLPLLF